MIYMYYLVNTMGLTFMCLAHNLKEARKLCGRGFRDATMRMKYSTKCRKARCLGMMGSAKWNLYAHGIKSLDDPECNKVSIWG